MYSGTKRHGRTGRQRDRHTHTHRVTSPQWSTGHPAQPATHPPDKGEVPLHQSDQHALPLPRPACQLAWLQAAAVATVAPVALDDPHHPPGRLYANRKHKAAHTHARGTRLSEVAKGITGALCGGEARRQQSERIWIKPPYSKRPLSVTRIKAIKCD